MTKHGVRNFSRVVYPDLKRKSRVLDLKGGCFFWQDIGARDCACANYQFSGYCLPRGGDIFLKFANILKDGDGARVKDVRLSRRHYGATKTVEETAFELKFQVANVLADGWLTGMQQLGGLGETFVLVDRGKYLQMSCFYGVFLLEYSGSGTVCLQSNGAGPIA